MTEEQKKLIEPIFLTIQNDDIREFAKILIDDAPQYIFEVPASSSGRFHPSYSLGDGGLIRHSIAVVRFLNFLLELEQYNTRLTERQMDCMRVACLTHDMRKSGSAEDYAHSKSTKFIHPLIMAEQIRKFKGEYLPDDEIDFIADCVSTHMGEWCSQKKSPVILPKPITGPQKVVHLCDYLASRKDLIMLFDNYETPVIEIPDITTYQLTFGKHSGKTLLEVQEIDPGWIIWAKDNLTREPAISLIKQLIKKEKQT